MANRLINETSPYLLQHAHNPVDWYPWGEEALTRAKAEDKPVFLSIGYSACHWCHVMAHESFEDPETAPLMNEHFVNIKVDREERPDLDSIYMEAIVAMTGNGGWPMSVFLKPDGTPFYGGTYFPPADRYGMPSFKRVLLSIAEAYRRQRQQIEQGGEQLKERIRQVVALRADPEIDRLVAELRLAQLAGTLLAFTAATYVGLAVAQPAVPGTGLDVAIAFGFGVVAATASWWHPQAALTALAAAFVGHALVDLAHRPGWLPAVVPRWYVVGCAVHNLATAALCYLPILRR